jgi:hypothetical protein
VSVEIALHRGIWIEGKVTEQATGKRVAGGWLHYMPFLENPFTRAIPEFHDRNVDGHEFQDRYMTRADGTYRLVGLPGRAIVGVVTDNLRSKHYLKGAGSEAIKGMSKHGHFETYFNPVTPGRFFPTSMKEINPPEGTEVVHLDLELRTGASVHLRLVDPEGRPITGVKVAGRGGRGDYEYDEKPAAELDVINLMPDEERTVMIRHEGRKLGKVLMVRPGDDRKGPVVVTLQPLAAIAGRVADADGNPVARANVRPDLLPSGDFSLHLSDLVTDEKGRFRVADVPTGCDYSLAVDSGGALKMRRFAFSSNAKVRPGETTDVGDIRFKER